MIYINNSIPLSIIYIKRLFVGRSCHYDSSGVDSLIESTSTQILALFRCVPFACVMIRHKSRSMDMSAVTTTGKKERDSTGRNNWRPALGRSVFSLEGDAHCTRHMPIRVTPYLHSLYLLPKICVASRTGRT